MNRKKIILDEIQELLVNFTDKSVEEVCFLKRPEDSESIEVS